MLSLKSFQDGVEFDPGTISKEEIKQYAADSKRTIESWKRRTGRWINTNLNTLTNWTIVLLVGSLLVTHTIYA